MKTTLDYFVVFVVHLLTFIFNDLCCFHSRIMIIRKMWLEHTVFLSPEGLVMAPRMEKGTQLPHQ